MSNIHLGNRIPVTYCYNLQANKCSDCEGYYDNRGICVWLSNEKKCWAKNIAIKNEKEFDEFCSGRA